MAVNGVARAAVLGGLLLAGCTESVTSSREDIPLGTVESIGSTLHASVPTCGGDPSASVVESADEVRLHVVSTVTRGGDQAGCADVAVATLKQPLGDRRVVDAVTDNEVTVVRR